MRFNPKARIDRSRVSDSRGGGGRSGGGAMRLPMPGGMKAGGGAAGLIITILFIVLASCLNGGLPGGSPDASGLDAGQMVESDTGRYDNCETGEDANEDTDCARVLVENSLRAYWEQALPDQAGEQLEPATMQTFSGSVRHRCGQATSQVGPFYCPPDQADLPRHDLLRGRAPAAARRTLG